MPKPLPLPNGPDLAVFNAVGTNAPGSFETRKQRRAREKAERELAEYGGGGGCDGCEDIIVTGSRTAAPVRRRERLQFAALPAPDPPPPPPAPAPIIDSASPVVVVDGATAKVEALGDLKLYRVPMRVTVAARAQKQVAMLVQPDATFERVYMLDVSNGSSTARAAPFELRARNIVGQGLGVPLPAGTVALFTRAAERNLFAGEAPIDDLAVGENVVLSFGDSPDVNWTLTRVADVGKKQQWRVDISNARDSPIRAEVTLSFGMEEKPVSAKRGERGWVLPVAIMPSEAASVTYTVKQ